MMPMFLLVTALSIAIDPVLDVGVPVDQKYASQRAKRTVVVGFSTARPARMGH